ncbi:hypothetical protein [Chryseobacterium koreense]|uniref:hypothetical protein n=1 Tax=Chryseobacterium koreense TaxID=232216 RepID=UPI0026EA3492|nr:hypothetical protein [Chryseobacterium koreense]
METVINTVNQQKFSAELLEKLTSLIEQQQIEYIFLHREKGLQYALLTVMGADRTFLTNALDQNRVQDITDSDRLLISVLDQEDVKKNREDGAVFFNRYARKTDQIYGNENNGNRDWYFEHDLKKIRERYLAGDEMLTKYAEELAQGETAGATLLYLKGIQHDLEFLEYLRFGRPFEDFALPERLRQMEAFIPEVKKFFVKDGSHYYLLRQIENEDVVEYMDEYRDLVCKAKDQMKRIVLRNMQAKQPKKIPLKPKVSHPLLKTPSVRKALRPLLQMAHLEEVYLFHEITSIQADLNLTHYYLLAVVSKEKAKEAARVTQKINEELPAHLKFTIIYHTRLWIQENVYQSQRFFKTLMNDAHKVYTNAFHPKIHWDRDDTFYCGDLFIYRRRAKGIYKRHLKGVARDEKSAMVSLIPGDLNEYFMQILINRLYDTVGYLPETRDVKVLWDLFVYLNKSDTDFNEILGSFSFDLLAYLSAHQHEKLPALKINQNEKKKLFSLLHKIKKTYSKNTD